jgi:hypothetical protein
MSAARLRTIHSDTAARSSESQGDLTDAAEKFGTDVDALRQKFADTGHEALDPFSVGPLGVLYGKNFVASVVMVRRSRFC